MSRQNIEAMRRIAAAAEEHNDQQVERMHGILKRLETERRNREERDAALKAAIDQIKSAIDQDRTEYNSVLKSIAGEVNQVIAAIQGAPMQIDVAAQLEQQAKTPLKAAE